MSMLILNFGDGEVTLEVPADGNITIGSTRSADIFINHPNVENRHAKISVDQNGDCWIRDLESTHGTFVNGRRVALEKLAPGDDMMFGLVVVQFVDLRSSSTHSLHGPLAVSSTPLNEPGPARTEQHSELMASDARLKNQSRSGYFLRLFFLLALVNAILFLACAIWFYSKTKSDFEKRFESMATTAHLAKPAVPTVSLQATGVGIPSDSQSELVLLKERNRLTSFADEAIATGARDPYDRLWDAIEDPRLANLVHAARAEILRVQDCYINGQRVKYYRIQQHQIPVREIFPASATLTPEQLSDDQLIQVLQNLKQSWQTRVKAAWHLGQHRSTKVGDALVKAIRSDPSLDVAAEATLSFEQITGYHAKLFDALSIEAWWKSSNEKQSTNKTTSKTPIGPGADSKPKSE